ncbi:MAG: DegT/DnrJ/EryC1/StrS family aminotransferase [Anaerovoracaceae bacterium]|nr:DegT/DnrJ/EryC1/StrS family aminotransferase [Anaerovoracaceae bacterium]
MQFRDLKKQYQVLKDRIDPAVIEVMTDAKFINGPQVGELEKQLADFTGAKHCITCGNGTDALYLAMLVWQFEKTDAVFVPDFTFFASAEVVALAGATPIFVDVDQDTFNIDPVKLEEQIERVLAEGTLRPRAVVPVDLFGLPADHKAVRKTADKYGMYVLEDAAQGFAGEIDGKRACCFGDISATSFFPAKPLGCYGDGGAVFTDNDEWAALLNSYHVHGKGSDKYDNVRLGVNSRLDTIQAAILRVKLEALAEYELSDVNSAAEKYTDALKDTVKTPVVPDGMLSSWAQYTIQLPDQDTRDGLQAYLKEHGVPSMIYYRKPMHRQGAFAETAHLYRDADYEVTNRLCDTVLSLPMHPYLTDEDIELTAKLVREYLK